MAEHEHEHEHEHEYEHENKNENSLNDLGSVERYISEYNDLSRPTNRLPRELARLLSISNQGPETCS